MSTVVRMLATMDLPDVVVTVPEELPKNVDRHDSQAVLRLNLEDRKDSLVQDGVPDVLRRLGVGRNLYSTISFDLSRRG